MAQYRPSSYHVNQHTPGPGSPDPDVEPLADSLTDDHDAEGLTDADAEGLTDTDAEGLPDAEGEPLGETERLSDKLSDRLSELDILSETLDQLFAEPQLILPSDQTDRPN